MKLYFLKEFSGNIRNVHDEGMWVTAKLDPSNNIDKFNEFFPAILDDDNDFEETKYKQEWLNNCNWYVVDNEKMKRGIYLPGVYPDMEINWRWK